MISLINLFLDFRPAVRCNKIYVDEIYEQFKVLLLIRDEKLAGNQLSPSDEWPRAKVTRAK